MLISEKLREFYYSQISNLKAMVEEIGNEDTADYEGPLLMYCWDNSYNSSNIKILFIGQETNGWNGFDRPKEKKDIDQLLKLYYDFQLGSNYNSIFWQHVNYINNQINPDKNLNFLWSNVLKIGRSGKGRPDENIQNAELKYFNILKDEIQIANPDAVIFFSGPYYDDDISLRIPDVKFINCSDFNERQFVMLKSNFLPDKTFRTYHPNYLRQSSNEAYLDKLIEFIKK